MKSQTQKILSLLKRKRAITQRDAIERVNCYRLSARIFELRRAGFEIVANTQRGFAAYTLIK
jgi:hypothetical protein